MSVYTDDQKRSWERDGYFIVKDAVDPAMVPELREAARRVVREFMFLMKTKMVEFRLKK